MLTVERGGGGFTDPGDFSANRKGNVVVLSSPSLLRIINFHCGEVRGFKKQRRGGWEPVANAEALINNPSAQPGANIAPIDEIVRVSSRLFDCGGAQGRVEERSNMRCPREINVY